jgi:predicted nucleic acid-binding protein
MTTLFVDSNVVVYSLDSRDPRKQARCLAWLKALGERQALILSPQVCAETRSVAVRKLKIAVDVAREAVRSLLPWCTAPLTAAEIDAALSLVDRWGVSWWDALILASAKSAGCTHLLTEDAQGAPVIEGIEIIDAFLVAPEDVLSHT